jgi:hypothetical protein
MTLDLQATKAELQNCQVELELAMKRLTELSAEINVAEHEEQVKTLKGELHHVQSRERLIREKELLLLGKEQSLKNEIRALGNVG